MELTLEDYDDIVDLASNDSRANGTEVGFFLPDEWGRPSRVEVIGARSNAQYDVYFDISYELFGNPNYISVSRDHSNWRDAEETTRI